ncbi:hypothetical protein MA16_Dca027646 [Dendrobium catenatum]|uniref:Uncharacterized protein n=1 Tax=Dendrobium catenatum TaxID=906689 RepID=A0A2I0V8U2_9ASPA|nr:hypothetical protein MA16_Dca027646 [Dendrobium catenatum]
MGFKQPLPFTARLKPVIPRTNRFKMEKELSQLGPIEELPRKRKKEGSDINCGGEASPFFF